MANGYTECVMTGEVTDLREFIARSFSNHAEDPVIFKDADGKWRYKKKKADTTFWSGRLKEEKDKLAWLNDATDGALADAANGVYIERSRNAADRKEHDQEKIRIRQRYESMMSKLKEWQNKLPHKGLLAFSRGLMSSLQESLKFDCGDRVADPETPVLQGVSQYKTAEVETCRSMILHYEECISNRIKEANADNELHNSLCRYLNDDLAGDFARSSNGPSCPSTC